MDNIWDVFNFIRATTNKQRVGNPTPTEVSTFLDQAQRELYQELKLAKDQGSPEADNALKPFKVSVDTTVNSSGRLTYPSDFGSLESIFESEVAITCVLDNELSNALKSFIDPISDKPRFRLEKDWIHIFPEEERSVTLAYLARPNTPFLAVTVDGNTYDYDAANSTQLDFDKIYWPLIIKKAFTYIGVNLNDPAVAGISK